MEILTGVVPGSVIKTGARPSPDLKPRTEYIVRADHEGELYVRAGRKYHALWYFVDGTLQGYDNIGGWLKFHKPGPPTTATPTGTKYEQMRELDTKMRLIWP